MDGRKTNAIISVKFHFHFKFNLKPLFHNMSNNHCWTFAKLDHSLSKSQLRVGEHEEEIEMEVFLYSSFTANDSLCESELFLLALVRWMYSGGVAESFRGEPF